MERLYLRKTIGSWSGGTPVEFVEDRPEGKILVRALSGEKRLDEELHRDRFIELVKEDLVTRK